MADLMCRNPSCMGGEFQPLNWLNHVFCSHFCREAWCRSHGRNAFGEPHEVAQPDAPGVSQSNGTLGHPPIVHAAGVIPPEVEQAVTEQIDQRKTAAAIVATSPWRHQVDDVRFEPEPYQALTPSKSYVFTPPEPGWLKRLLTRWFG